MAFTDESAPGTESGVYFDGFSPPVLNNAGQVAFKGVLYGSTVGSPKGTGIWSEGGGSGLDVIARTGDAAVGTEDGVYFSNFDWPLLNDKGQIAFDGQLEGEGIDEVNNQGIWTETRGGGLDLVARDGDLILDTDDDTHFSYTQSLQLGSNGSLVFVGALFGADVDSTNARSFWSEGPDNNLTLVARGGSHAPSTESGVNFDVIQVPRINTAGNTIFLSSLRGTGIDTTNSSGIWRGRGGDELEVVARRGDNAPGFQDNVKLAGFFYNVEINDSGQVALRSILVGPGVDIFNDQALWRSDPGSELKLIAREGSPAPGTESDTIFAHIGHHVINELGQSAFRGALTGPDVFRSGGGGRGDSPRVKNDIGLWSESDEGLFLIARAGDRAPGTEEGVVFENLNFGNGSLTLNYNGQSTFIGQLAGPSIDSTNRGGIWAQDFSGQLHKIARTGDMIDIDDGPGIDLRKIAALGFVGDDHQGSVPRSGFNDFGQLAFWVNFTDGSQGIFVSNLVAIPEPSALILSALAAVGLLMRKW